MVLVLRFLSEFSGMFQTISQAAGHISHVRVWVQPDEFFDPVDLLLHHLPPSTSILGLDWISLCSPRVTQGDFQRISVLELLLCRVCRVTSGRISWNSARRFPTFMTGPEGLFSMTAQCPHCLILWKRPNGISSSEGGFLADLNGEKTITGKCSKCYQYQMSKHWQ